MSNERNCQPYTEIKINNWILMAHTADERLYMEPLFRFILKLFTEVFGTELLEKESAILYNDKLAPCPMLVINQAPIAIRTCVEDLCYWSQFIYQLSHELMHYTIRQYRSKDSGKVKWFEETICEAVSLYILQRSGEKWSECAVSDGNLSYAKHLREYLINEYNHTGESILEKCHTISALQTINATCEKQRTERSLERNYLYKLFYSQPSLLPIVAQYSRYAKDNLLLDLSKWECDVGGEYISNLRPIYPNIKQS